MPWSRYRFQEYRILQGFETRLRKCDVISAGTEGNSVIMVRVLLITIHFTDFKGLVDQDAANSTATSHVMAVLDDGITTSPDCLKHIIGLHDSKL